ATATRHTGLLARQTLPVERQIAARIDGCQVDALDLLASLYQHVREILFGLRIAELSSADDRTDQLVGKSRDPPRRPERIVVAHLHVGDGRGLWPPLSRHR